MRMCDRKGCYERQAQTLFIKNEGREIDLCARCNNAVMEFIDTPIAEPPPIKKVKKKKRI